MQPVCQSTVRLVTHLHHTSQPTTKPAMPQGSAQMCSRTLTRRLRGSVMKRITLPNFAEFLKDIRFPTNLGVPRVGNEMQKVSLTQIHICTIPMLPPGAGEKARMGCRACPSKDHSSGLAFDSSHARRLQKSRLLQRSEGRTYNPALSSSPHPSCYSTTWHLKDVSH